MASGHGRVLTTKLRFVRSGRKAVMGVRSLNFRFWLQAEVRARLIDVRSRTDNGHCCGEVRFRSD
jgi:hypothetical protein